MRRNSLLFAFLLGALIALDIVALLYLGMRFASLPFVPFDLFDWMARVLPGPLVTAVIDLLVKLIDRLNLGPTSTIAKLVQKAIAIIQFVLGGAIFAVALASLGRRRPERLMMFGVSGGLLLLASILLVEVSLGFPAAGPALSMLWLAVVFASWGALLGWLVREFVQQPVSSADAPLSRREFLYLVGAGSFTVLISALGLSLSSGEEDKAAPDELASVEEMVAELGTSGPAASPSRQVLEARFKPVPGTRPELTSSQDFYRVDINALPPQVDEEPWRLEVTGLVENPLSLSLADLRSRPAVSQVITLECISNGLGGDLISTAVWTGVRLKDILLEAGLRPGAKEVYIESADGFYESVNEADMLDDRTLLVYEMNGEPLTAEHGFPLRIYIPNRFGMKQPKWITRLEVIDYDGPGYWVERGWSARAVPPTTSVIDTVQVDPMNTETGLVPIGGIAYAGARGISKVEVQVDDGPWEAVELRTPPLSPLTWVQWRHFWRAEPGRHTVRVRAYDGTGALQVTRLSGSHPNGATGIHSFTVKT